MSSVLDVKTSAGQARERLADIVNRAGSLAEALCGPVPESASKANGSAPLANGLVRQLEDVVNDIHELLTKLDAQIERIGVGTVQSTEPVGVTFSGNTFGGNVAAASTGRLY
jgi:hypothetical protein